MSKEVENEVIEALSKIQDLCNKYFSCEGCPLSHKMEVDFWDSLIIGGQDKSLFKCLILNYCGMETPDEWDLEFVKSVVER